MFQSERSAEVRLCVFDSKQIKCVSAAVLNTFKVRRWSWSVILRQSLCLHHLHHLHPPLSALCDEPLVEWISVEICCLELMGFLAPHLNMWQEHKRVIWSNSWAVNKSLTYEWSLILVSCIYPSASRTPSGHALLHKMAFTSTNIIFMLNMKG